MRLDQMRKLGDLYNSPTRWKDEEVGRKRIDKDKACHAKEKEKSLRQYSYQMTLQHFWLFSLLLIFNAPDPKHDYGLAYQPILRLARSIKTID